MYSDVTKGWLAHAIKRPLLSIVSETDLNLDFTAPNIDAMTKE